MQNFLATLAQVSATLLGIFLAATIAYLVFLNDRLATFSEQIEELKVDIGSQVSLMNTEWPQSLEYFVPPQFRDRFREKYPAKSEPALINQLSTDLIFHIDGLVKVVGEASGSHFSEGPWEGRLYTFVLTEIVRAIGGGVPGSQSAVFPASPSGLGFDPWRENFKEIQASVHLLRMFRSAMISNFAPYVREQPYEDQTRKLANESIERFFTTIDQTQAKLEQIDKLTLAKARYLPHDYSTWFSLATTCILWFFLGIALPLALLAFPQTSITSLAAIAILIGTLLFSGISVAQFVINFQPKSFDWQSYARQRWFIPIVEELKQQDIRATVHNAGIVDTRYIYASLNSSERNRFDIEIIGALEDYLKVSTQYNEIVLRFDASVVAAIQADPLLGPLVSNYKSMRGGPVLYPYEFVADEQRFKGLLVEWEKRLPASEDDISVETVGPNWSRVELKVPGKRLYEDPAKARLAFERVRASIISTETAQKLIDAKERVEKSSLRLRKVLEQKLRE